MSKLIYVSHNAIDSVGHINPFFEQERVFLQDRFGTYSIICNAGVFFISSSGELEVRHKKDYITRVKGVFNAILDSNVYREIARMFKEHKGSLINILKIIRYSYDASVLYFLIKQAFDNDTCVLYSFWFSFDAYACAKIKEERPDIKFITRAHAYEIQLNRNLCNPYLMKQYTCEHSDRIAFISMDALESFKGYYKKPLNNTKVIYLGSTKEGTGAVERIYGGRLIILSCSSIVPVKRLDRLITVLAKWEREAVHWIHIGDGPDRKKIETMAAALLDSNSAVTYEFLGFLQNVEVHHYLQRRDINVFVNVSDSEGVPVSIMEAMSAGLPVIAPRICGIPELVDDDCGLLFDIEHAEEEILEVIERFSNMSIEEQNRMGKASFEKWEKCFCLEENLSELFS